MAEVHYLISDASKQVDVESHVLRYWEDELELDIPRNDMGHRYYTEYHIRLFRKIKELKEKGYQLKAIKSALNKMAGAMGEITITEDYMEEDMKAAWNEGPAREMSRPRPVEAAREQAKGRPVEPVREQAKGRPVEPVREQAKGRPVEPVREQPKGRPGEMAREQPKGRPGEMAREQAKGRPGEAVCEQPKGRPAEAVCEQPKGCSAESFREQPKTRAGETAGDHLKDRSPEAGVQPRERTLKTVGGQLSARQGEGPQKLSPNRGTETEQVQGQAQTREAEAAREQLKARILEGTRQQEEGRLRASPEGRKQPKVRQQAGAGTEAPSGENLPKNVRKQEETSRQKQETMPQKIPMSELSPEKINSEKMARFQSVMNHIIGRAMDANLDRLAREVSNTVSEDVTDKVMKEVEYLLRVSDEKEEERFRQLDETIRAYQRQGKGRAEAAAAKVPFFRKKKFGKSGKKMF